MSVTAMAATLLIAIPAIPMLGGTIDLSSWVLCSLCPLIIVFPAGTYIFSQAERLAAAHDQLLEAHGALAEAHEKLSEKARRDGMTGMLNRQSFIDALEDIRAETSNGALLILDADHFKKINDGYGHLAGDAALHAICAALVRTVRPRDLVGRIGGEEFGVFLVEAEETQASVDAERIRREIESTAFKPIAGRNIRLTVSIGGTVCRPGMTISDLMREADTRLYEAKRLGRNRVIMEPGLPRAA